MLKIQIDEIVKITNGILLRQGEASRYVLDVSTDTRCIPVDSLFVALGGKNFDGHDYLAEAVEKGACAVCISDSGKLVPGDYSAILVEDTLKAYQTIASAMREKQGYKVIGVTGSVGKTSTREMITASIAGELRTYQTKENFNNEIGLPRTLLETPENTQVCVVEMGMRGAGEIRELALIARPDIAVITNIGIAHIERLGSQDRIFKAKTEIVDGLKDGGLLVLNANDPYLVDYCNQMASQIRIAMVSVNEEIISKPEFSIRAFHLRQTSDSVVFDIEVNPFRDNRIVIEKVMIPVPGVHNVSNALIGIAAAMELGINLTDAIEGLSNYRPVGNRQRIIHHGTWTIIDDSYNAGLESMQAAIVMLSGMAGAGRKIAVLGGMLELGDYSSLAHTRIGEICFQERIDRIYACGKDAEYIRKGLEGSSNVQKIDASDSKSHSKVPQIQIFETREELTSALIAEIEAYDILLVKGSRGFEMEKVTQTLLAVKE